MTMRSADAQSPPGAVLRTSKAAVVAEIAIVFLIAAVVVGVGWSLVGPDALHRQAVVWVANVLMLGTVWIGLRVRGHGWADLGLRLRGSGVSAVVRLIVQAVVVLILGVVAFVAGGIAMQSMAAAGAAAGAAADTSGYDYLQDNLPGLLMALAAVYVVSSFGEEVLYRGFLISRVQALTGDGAVGSGVAVLVSAVIFGLAHFDWGLVGIVQTFCMGLAFAAAYVLTKQNLWALVMAHAIMDTLLLVQVYLGPASS
jgi:hypothetical protein